MRNYYIQVAMDKHASPGMKILLDTPNIEEIVLDLVSFQSISRVGFKRLNVINLYYVEVMYKTPYNQGTNDC